jgi:hypothetical protein
MAAVAIAILLAAAGLLLLHRSWARRAGGWRLGLGWTALAAAALAWRFTGVAWDKAWTYAGLALCLAPLPLLASGAEWRRTRARRQREPEALPAPRRPGRNWRTLARVILAGPVAGAASVGLAAAIALRAPLGEADRLILAGFVLPAAWAVCGVWATTDGRLIRAALGLAGLAAAGFGVAVL